MATRKVWYTLSAVLMIVSLASFFTRGLNLAIDFTGGVNAEVNFPHAADVEAVRTQLVAAGFHEPQVQRLRLLARHLASGCRRIRSRPCHRGARARSRGR